MAYITRTDLERRFGATEIADLLDDDADGDEITTEADSLLASIDDACNLIDGYLLSRYTLPLSAVPDMLKSWACDIARFKLWADRAPEEVRKRYEDAIGQLKDLARGLISLPPDSDGDKPTSSGATNMTGYSNARIFNDDGFVGF